MERDADTQAIRTTSDFLSEVLTDEQNGQNFTEEYLKASFLSSAVDALFYARRQAGFTQAQVAERLNTKQAAIARLEADTAGSMSLHRYVEVALACGMVPLDITLAPIAAVRDYMLAHPGATLTLDAYHSWLSKPTLSEVNAVQADISVIPFSS